MRILTNKQVGKVRRFLFFGRESGRWVRFVRDVTARLG